MASKHSRVIKKVMRCEMVCSCRTRQQLFADCISNQVRYLVEALLADMSITCSGILGRSCLDMHMMHAAVLKKCTVRQPPEDELRG